MLMREERSRQPSAPRHSALPFSFSESREVIREWMHSLCMWERELGARLEKGAHLALPVSPACNQKAMSSLASVPMPGRTCHSRIPCPVWEEICQSPLLVLNSIHLVSGYKKEKGFEIWYLHLINARGWWKMLLPPRCVWFGTTKMSLCWNRPHCRNFPFNLPEDSSNSPRKRWASCQHTPFYAACWWLHFPTQTMS